MTLKGLVVCVALLAVFIVAVRVSADPDTWRHLRAGRWLVENRQVMTLLALPVRRGALNPVVLTCVSVIESPVPLARGRFDPRRLTVALRTVVLILLGAEAWRVTRREWPRGQAGVPV